MPAATALEATTADGALLVLAIVLPVVGILLSFVLGGRYAERIAAFLLPARSRRGMHHLPESMAKRNVAELHCG
jgi:cytochrome b561